MPINNTKYNLVIYLVLIIGLCVIPLAKANPLSSLGLPKVVPLEAAFELTLTHEDNLLKANWQIAPNCYLYQNSIKFILNKGSAPNAISGIDFPPGIEIDDPTFGKQITYQHGLNLTVNLTKALQNAPYQALLQIEYQGCAKSGFCYPPVVKYFELSVEKNQLVALMPTTVPELTTNKTVNTQQDKPLLEEMSLKEPAQTFWGYLSTIGTFYLAGILLSFTPCVWPMIPILASIIVGQAHLNTRKAFWLSLCYVLSMAISYAIAGIIAATLGKNLQASLQHPAIIISFSFLFAILGLMQLGIVRITMPPHFRLKDLLHALHAKQESGTYIGAAMMGVLATLISSPCITPALIFALGYISHSGSITLGGSALLAMGLGMGTLLLTIGTLGGKFLPRSGPWMHHVNQVFAIIMFGLSIWMLDRFYHQPWTLILWALLCIFIAFCMNTFKKQAGISARIGVVFVMVALTFLWGTYRGFHDPLQVLSHLVGETPEVSKDKFKTITTSGELNDILNKSQKQDKAVMVEIYADWCVACQHMERDVFSSSEVIGQLEPWRLVRLNVTNFNTQAEALLKKFDLIGPPAVLFFSPDGSELTKYRIIGGVSKKQFLIHLSQIKDEKP